MKAYICDNCKQQVEPSTYDVPPAGWYSVTSHGSGYKTQQFCSGNCLIAAIPLTVSTDDGHLIEGDAPSAPTPSPAPMDEVRRG